MNARTAFLIGLFAFFVASVRRDLWAPDEPRHAEVARQMAASGEFLVPHLNGAVYSDKPAPPFWTAALAMKLFGEHDWAARIPFALASAGTLAVTVAILRLLGYGRAALLAVLVLATAFRFLWLSQRVSLDAMLTFFTTLALLGWVRQRKGVGSALGNGLWFFGAAACAVSVKGPNGLWIPLAAALGHALATRSTARFCSAPFLAPIALLFAVIAAWLVPACMAAGWAYAKDLVVTQSFGRIAAAWNHEKPFWYYLVELPAEFLPWTPLLAVAAVLLARKRLAVERDAVALLAAWTLIPLVVLSCVQSKRGSYLLPLYPPLALVAAIAAHEIAERGTAAARRALAGSAWFVAGALVLCGTAALVAPFLPQLADFGLEGLTAPAIGLGLLLLAAGALTAARLRARGPLPALEAAGGALLLVAVAAGLFIAPVVDGRKSERAIAEVLAREVRPGAGFVPFLDVRAEAYRFYSRLDCREVDDRAEFLEALERPDVDLAVIDGKRLGKLRRPIDRVAEVLLERDIGDGDRVAVLRVTR